MARLNSKSIVLSLLALSILLIKSDCHAESVQVVDLDGTEGTTEFLAIGSPSFLEIRGKGKAPAGQIQIKDGSAQGSLTVPIDSFDTGIEARNHHMKTVYLDTTKYPVSTLTFRGIQVSKNFSNANYTASEFPISAILTLHGISQPVTVLADLERKSDGSSLSLHAHFKLKLTQYGVKIPTFAGITVADEVQITIQTAAPIISIK
jgi:polyisoprenoid-binding protein YceI